MTIKSTYEVLDDALDAIDFDKFPPFGNDCPLPTPYGAECARICAEHGWTVEEYDAELEKRFNAKYGLDWANVSSGTQKPETR